jgi:hypothetical protein
MNGLDKTLEENFYGNASMDVGHWVGGYCGGRLYRLAEVGAAA